MSIVKHIFEKDSLKEISLHDVEKLIDARTEESLH